MDRFRYKGRVATTFGLIKVNLRRWLKLRMGATSQTKEPGSRGVAQPDSRRRDDDRRG